MGAGLATSLPTQMALHVRPDLWLLAGGGRGAGHTDQPAARGRGGGSGGGSSCRAEGREQRAGPIAPAAATVAPFQSCAPRARLTAKNDMGCTVASASPSTRSLTSSAGLPGPQVGPGPFTCLLPPAGCSQPAGAALCWCCSHKPGGSPHRALHLPLWLLWAHLPRYPGALLPAPGDERCSAARHTLPSFPKGPGLIWVESFSREAAKAFLEDQPGAGHFLVPDPWHSPTRGSPGLYTASRLSYTRSGGQRGPHPAVGEATRRSSASSRSPPSARCLFQARGGRCPAAGQQEQGWEEWRAGMRCPGEEADQGRGGEGVLPSQTASRLSPAFNPQNFHLPLQHSEPWQREAVHPAK